MVGHLSDIFLILAIANYKLRLIGGNGIDGTKSIVYLIITGFILTVSHLFVD